MIQKSMTFMNNLVRMRENDVIQIPLYDLMRKYNNDSSYNNECLIIRISSHEYKIKDLNKTHFKFHMNYIEIKTINGHHFINYDAIESFSIAEDW